MKTEKLSKRKISIIISLTLFILIGFRLVWIAMTMIPTPPQTEVGLFDLTDVSVTEDEIITLNGDWDFYPGQFLLPHSMNDHSSEKEIISVPGDWRDSLRHDAGNSPYGFGTYHLKIKLPETGQKRYALRIPDIYTSSDVYMNDERIGSSGRPGTSAKDTEPKRRPYTVTFSSDDRHVDLVIHVANYTNHLYGGIIDPIEFGAVSAMTNKSFISAAIQLIVSAIFLIHALYALIIYLMKVEKKELFYFFILLLSISIAILLDDDRLLLSIAPLSYEWAYKLEQVAYLSVALFSLLFIRSLLSKHPNTRMYTWAIRSFSVFYAVLLILPIPYARYLSFFIVAVIIFTFVYLLQFIIRIVLTEHTQAIFLLVSVVAMISTIVWPSILHWTDVYIGFYPIDMIVALIGFASFLFKHYIDMSHQNKKFARKLLKEDKRKDQFLANTSHELRNPLHSMIAITQSVVENEQLQLDERHRKSLDTVITVGQQMAFTLNDLLDITLLKEKRLQLQRKEVDLQAVAATVIDMLRYLVDEKNVTFNLAITDRLPTVYADENRLMQIFFNLLHNAVKHTDEGEIAVGAHVIDDHVNVFIKDTGIGMSSAAQQNIFRPYEQIDSTRESSESGLGLGLSICKELVELHGGSINVQSKMNVGTTFSFTMPTFTDASQPASDESQVAATVEECVTNLPGMYHRADYTKVTQKIPVIKGARILVVDDDRLNVQVLDDLLSSDYDVVKATSGKEALEHIQTDSWDLVISDVMMPGMSGYALSAKIREHFAIAELPILLLTARDQSIDLYTGFSSGANDYLTKPIDALELKIRVHALITLKYSIHDKLSMEAAWLQAQIQPHFIFNTLNTIISLRYIDLDRMTKLLREFGNYLRISFMATNAGSTVPLEDELALVHSYLFIEKERFNDRLNIVWEMDANLSIDVPPISIQTIVENAVRHGVLTRIDGGTVTIRIKDNGDYVKIHVIDDGVGMSEDKVSGLLQQQENKQAGIGLINTNKRLLQLYGEGLQISSSPGEGTEVTFIIPNQ